MTEGRELATLVADMLAPLGPVEVKRFFGGYGLLLNGVQFAMIARGILYLRTDADLATEMIARDSQPFSYESGRGRVTLSRYYAVPDDMLDDGDLLVAWSGRALAAARLSPPARKKRRKAAEATP